MQTTLHHDFRRMVCRLSLLATRRTSGAVSLPTGKTAVSFASSTRMALANDNSLQMIHLLRLRHSHPMENRSSISQMVVRSPRCLMGTQVLFELVHQKAMRTFQRTAFEWFIAMENTLRITRYLFLMLTALICPKSQQALTDAFIVYSTEAARRSTS